MNAPRLRQVCLVAPELAPMETELAAILDLCVVHRDPNLARFGLQNVIFAAGPRFIEIVAPIEDHTAAGRFLERSGGRGGYMAIFDGGDPDARAAHAETLGVRAVNRLRHDTYTGRQLHPRDCRAAMIEFNHTEGGERLDGPYWPAGAHWREAPASKVVRGLAGIDLATPAPEALARHWGRILQRQATPDAAAYRIEVTGCDLRFHTGDGPKEYLEGLRLTVTDPEAALQRAVSRGHTVTGDHFQLAGVKWRLNPEPD